MTVPPEPSAPRDAQVFRHLVGIDRAVAAIPFSSDVVCDPRIHVSETSDAPPPLLVLARRGQHRARYALAAQGITLSVGSGGLLESSSRHPGVNLELVSPRR